MSLYDLVISAIVSISAFLGVSLILERRTSPYPQHLLGLALFIVGGTFAYIVLNSLGILMQFPHLLRVFSPFLYLIGPLFFLYIKQVVYQDFTLKRVDYLHFLPAIFHFFDLMPFYLLSAEEKQMLATAITEDINVLFRQGGGLIPIGYHYGIRIILLIAYALWIGTMILRYKSRATSKASFNHIREVAFFFFLLVFSLTTLFILGIGYFSPKLEEYGTLFFVNIFALLLLSGFGLLSFRQRATGVETVLSVPSMLVNDHVKNDQEKNGQAIDKVLYPSERIEQLALEMQEFFQSEAFKNPEIKTKDLANFLHVPERDVNPLMTEIYGFKFNRKINQVRVEEAKRLIRDQQQSHLTMEALGQEAGFPSRSSFFRVFKEETDMTPAEFKKTCS